MSETPTPRTDACEVLCDCGANYVDSDVARNLERALTAERAAREKAEKKLDAVTDHALRLLMSGCEKHEKPNFDDLKGCLICERAARERAEAEAERLREDAAMLTAIERHGWVIGRDLEGDWEVGAPRRYGDPRPLGAHSDLRTAITKAIDAARKERP